MDELEQFPATLIFPGGGHEYLRQRFPSFEQGFSVHFRIPFHPVPGYLISFGKYEDEGNPVAPQKVEEFPVCLLHFQPYVEEQEEAGKAFASQDVLPDQSVHFLPVPFGHPGIPVSRQVHQVPGIVDQEMIDQLGFPGGRRSPGEP